MESQFDSSQKPKVEDLEFDHVGAFSTDEACFQIPSKVEWDPNQPVPAPPSYEEATGISDNKDVVSFVDFLPTVVEPGRKDWERCPQFTSFSILVEIANQWLLKTPSTLQIIRCECVERMTDYNGQQNLSKSLELESGCGLRIFVTCLRLWYRMVSVNKTVADDNNRPQIGYVNVLPKISFEMERMECYNRMGMGRRRDRFIRKTTLESLEDLEKRINQKLQENPLSGQLLNVCTILYRLDPNAAASSTGSLDMCVQWYKAGQIRLIAYLHRIFYLKGDTISKEQIQLRCFSPVPIKMVNMATMVCLYEPMEETSKRAMEYVQTVIKSGGRVTDFQTVYHTTTITGGFYLMDALGGCVDPWPQIGVESDMSLGPGLPNNYGMKSLAKLNSQQTCEMHTDNIFHRREYRCIRVASITADADDCSNKTTPELQQSLSLQLYNPHKLSGRNFTQAEQFYESIMSTVNNSQNCRVITVETSTNYVNPDAKVVRCDVSSNIRPADGKYRLYGLRILFDGPAPQDNIVVADNNEQSKNDGKKKSGSCIIV